MASSIGIKIANGEFYPVLEEGSTVRKRLVLTTVHDGQRSVQIDLYRSESRSMIDAAYIGSLVVEDIADKPKGEPSIELIVSASGPDELKAEASDLDGDLEDSRQILTVSLQALNDQETYDVPDFELESEIPTPPPAGLYEEPEAEDEKPARSAFPVLPAALALSVVLLIAAILVWLFAFGGVGLFAGGASEAGKISDSSVSAPVQPVPVPPAAVAVSEQQKAPPVQPAQPAVQAPVSKTEAADRRARPSAPVKTYKVPKTIPKDGFRYRIRWGDTLWDISEAFYRNPWLYPRIARFNKIRNPDRILSGSYIRIPPKN